MRFFLGTHHAHWLRDERFDGVPLFISRRQLAGYAKLPGAATDFALDSGGFTELQMHGRWSMTVYEYAEEVQRYVRHYGRRLQWVAPQDWMCEKIVLAGGKGAGGIVFKGTGLTVEEHQRRTVINFVQLRSLLRELVVPVLQGWTTMDYWRCQSLYADAGVDLAQHPIVGVGTVCRRQSTNEATQIMQTLAVDGLRLHGFGFKKAGLANCHTFMASADSTAWSYGARKRILLPGHDKPGPGRPRGHINCANCAEYALQWRRELLDEIGQKDAA